jgi:hypothetical protein
MCFRFQPACSQSKIISFKDQFDDPVYVHYDLEEFDYRIRQHLNQFSGKMNFVVII